MPLQRFKKLKSSQGISLIQPYDESDNIVYPIQKLNKQLPLPFLLPIAANGLTQLRTRSPTQLLMRNKEILRVAQTKYIGKSE